MILTETEIQRVIERVRAAFPRFSNWEHNNEANESYSGFAVWGEFIPEPDDLMRRTFFLTFDTHEATWAGHLSIGKSCYYWSSTDTGDALLVDTDPCATLEDAIANLKREIADLFRVFRGSAAEP